MQDADSAVNKVSARDAKRITEVLGQKRHDQLLCYICMLRSHSESGVSNMAGRVLRSLVDKVAEKVDNMFPQLMSILIPMMLGSSTTEHALLAAHCCGALGTNNKVLEAVMVHLTPLAERLKEGSSPVFAANEYIGVLRGLLQV